MVRSSDAQAQGISVKCRSAREEAELAAFLDRLHLYADVVLERHLAEDGMRTLSLRLRPSSFAAWTPGFDTINLSSRLHADREEMANALKREILVAMLASPVMFDYPSADELLASIRIRRNIVLAGQHTALNFRTDAADRPEDCWQYDEDNGFVVRHGHSLIDALRKATQPDLSGRMYAFSCYRATEYVLLLGIAEELESANPDLLARLQLQCETRVIRSGQFHDVFLREYGAQETPLPLRYYVPGDRLWFRNPDDTSSDVTGYEGSWVIYLGGGLFTNFWKRECPYTLESKSIEIFHWRDALRQGGDGEWMVDEVVVEDRIRATQKNPAEMRRILGEMMRWREPKGCYGHGGCLDTTREYPRWICPDTGDIHLPLH